MTVRLSELVEYLDAFLNVATTPDYPGAHNGLQVENSGNVTRVIAAVDAAQASIDAAARSGADLLIVHHGLFWDGAAPITGRRWRRVRTLLHHDIALYASHLPLDRHGDVGNNVQLARALGLSDLEPVGVYQGVHIGVAGTVNVGRDDLVQRLTGVLHVAPRCTLLFGPERVRKVAVITGGAGSSIGEMVDAGVDTFITGEGAHHTFFDAEELEINVIYGGHYATETFGVKALAAHVETQFGLPCEFFDHPTGL